MRADREGDENVLPLVLVYSNEPPFLPDGLLMHYKV